MENIRGYDNWKLDYTDGADYEGEDAKQCAFCDFWIDPEIVDHKPWECPICKEDADSE